MAIVCIARCIHNGRYSGHLFHCLVYSTSCSGRQISPENQRLDHIATPPPPPPLPGSSKRPTKRSKPKRVVVCVVVVPSSPVFFFFISLFFLSLVHLLSDSVTPVIRREFFFAIGFPSLSFYLISKKM